MTHIAEMASQSAEMVTMAIDAFVKKDMKLAISMYPTSLDELMAVADNGDIMPPKSTWFEPKLRSGILIHKI